ncbi:hypothetical protein M6B38_215140 [Iris pallida]|uniref:Uncharacterized protein n=1 Tax=Iris pallida TaxID=29817 RepID=A0AAX6E1V0_IRIPA|nr:hypothetical protein M6B38_215140 [Iris pallida]
MANRQTGLAGLLHHTRRHTRHNTRQDTLPLLFKFSAQYHACFSCFFLNYM